MIINMENAEKEKVIKEIFKGLQELKKDLEKDLKECEIIPFSHYAHKRR
jgi:hypothetical protein